MSPRAILKRAGAVALMLACTSCAGPERPADCRADIASVQGALDANAKAAETMTHPRGRAALADAERILLRRLARLEHACAVPPGIVSD